MQKHESFDKAHGREEHRIGYLLPIDGNSLALRWAKSQMKTLLVVKRKIKRSKDGNYSHQMAYYVSNKALVGKTGLELFNAVRGHWAVESDNYVREVTLGEDQIKCKQVPRIRIIASAINTVLNNIRRTDKNNNIRAFREELVFNRNMAISCLSAT
jgi:hypothetical protein